MIVWIVILVTTFALVAGAVWGAYFSIPKRLQGFLVALAGGALIVALTDEMVRPASESLSVPAVLVWLLVGASAFTALDYFVDEMLQGSGGFGLLLAVTLDGVPENLALGTALIGGGALGAASLAGSIFLSNLPEAAGGARSMVEDGRSPLAAVGLWVATATLLSASALVGFYALSGAPAPLIGAIKCVAAGAVIASLSTEVFPQAFREDHHLSGIAVALGFCIAFALNQLGS